MKTGYLSEIAGWFSWVIARHQPCFTAARGRLLDGMGLNEVPLVAI
jgi:hypothetical protein